MSTLRSQESEAAGLNLSLASSCLKTIPSLVGKWVLKIFSWSLHRNEPLGFENRIRGLQEQREDPRSALGGKLVASVQPNIGICKATE